MLSLGRNKHRGKVQKQPEISKYHNIIAYVTELQVNSMRRPTCSLVINNQKDEEHEQEKVSM